MVRFQITTLISFGLRKFYHLSNFQWPELFEDDISVIFNRFSSTKCLSIAEKLANAKLLVVGKLLAVRSVRSDNLRKTRVYSNFLDAAMLALPLMLGVGYP